jgi:hypothetical protein
MKKELSVAHGDEQFFFIIILLGISFKLFAEGFLRCFPVPAFRVIFLLTFFVFTHEHPPRGEHFNESLHL